MPCRGRSGTSGSGWEEEEDEDVSVAGWMTPSLAGRADLYQIIGREGMGRGGEAEGARVEAGC